MSPRDRLGVRTGPPTHPPPAAAVRPPGLPIRPVEGSASVVHDEDGFPVVRLEGVDEVTNEQALAAIQADRAER